MPLEMPDDIRKAVEDAERCIRETFALYHTMAEDKVRPLIQFVARTRAIYPAPLWIDARHLENALNIEVNKNG